MKNHEIVTVRGDFDAACAFAVEPDRKVKVYPEKGRNGAGTEVGQMRTPLELDVLLRALPLGTYRIMLIGEKGLTRDSVTVQRRVLRAGEGSADPADEQTTE